MINGANIAIRLALIGALGILPPLALAQTPASETTDQQARIEHLQNAILAPCCYSEAVARHRSEIANKMRAEIALWVKHGKSDREILDTYKNLYGTQVLIEPEGTTWWWLQIVPWAVFVIGGAVVVWFLRRRRAQQATGSEDTGAQALNLPDLDEG